MTELDQAYQEGIIQGKIEGMAIDQQQMETIFKGTPHYKYIVRKLTAGIKESGK